MLYPPPAAKPAQARSWIFPHSSAQVQPATALAHHLLQMSQPEAPYMKTAKTRPRTHNCSGRFRESSSKAGL
jgi:hypothetical protein